MPINRNALIKYYRYADLDYSITKDYYLYPYLLKEYRNRWFVFGARTGDRKLVSLALDKVAGR